MVKNSGDTQARFLEKSLVFFSNQHSAFSQRRSTAKDAKRRKENAAKTLNSKRGRKLEKYRNPQHSKSVKQSCGVQPCAVWSWGETFPR
jgi:hypothetical protein